MRSFTRVIVLVVATLLLIGAAPAAIGRSHSLKATFEGPTNPPIRDEGAVAARCPDGSEWIFGGFGTGTMTSAVYTGGFVYENDHCSRWVAFDPERSTGRYVGKAAAGIMTVTTPAGDEFVLEYDGTWVFEGSLAGAPPEFVADINMRYTIVGGTGVFAEASGNGRLFVTGGIYLTGLINGSLHVSG